MLVMPSILAKALAACTRPVTTTTLVALLLLASQLLPFAHLLFGCKIMNQMQSVERNIPMKNVIESAEQELAELHSRLVHITSVLHPVLAPENINGCASVDASKLAREESPLVRDVRNLAAGINDASRIIEALMARIEV